MTRAPPASPAWPASSTSGAPRTPCEPSAPRRSTPVPPRPSRLHAFKRLRKMPDLPLPDTAVRLQRRLVELFVELCKDPDSAATATEVDRTLERLDDILTQADR